MDTVCSNTHAPDGETHQHKCFAPFCRVVWEHTANSAGDRAAHTCPVCLNTSYLTVFDQPLTAKEEIERLRALIPIEQKFMTEINGELVPNPLFLMHGEPLERMRVRLGL